MSLGIVNKELPPGYLGFTYVTEQMKTFLGKLNAIVDVVDGISLSVGLVEAGYFLTEDACYGWMGPSNHDPSYERPAYQASCHTLEIRFTISNASLDSKKALWASLHQTPGGRPNAHHQMVISSSKFENYEEVRGIYKKEGFDDLLAAFRKFKPTLTAIQLATLTDGNGYEYGYDYDLVDERPWTTDENCLKKFTGRYSRSTPYTDVCLSILNDDIERNTETLLQILTK